MNSEYEYFDPRTPAEQKSEWSADFSALAAALAAAQGRITGALKDSENPFFKSRYADLAACWDACRKALSENGLCVIQIPSVEEDFVVVTTTLAHTSGQWVRSRLPMRPKDFSPQAIGSTITYARRYALASMVGLAQVDDDAESAQNRNPKADPAIVKDFARRMQEGLDIGMGQAVLDLHRELNEDQDLYREVWSKIPSGARKQIKEMIDRSKS